MGFRLEGLRGRGLGVGVWGVRVRGFGLFRIDPLKRQPPLKALNPKTLGRVLTPCLNVYEE